MGERREGIFAGELGDGEEVGLTADVCGAFVAAEALGGEVEGGWRRSGQGSTVIVAEV